MILCEQIHSHIVQGAVSCSEVSLIAKHALGKRVHIFWTTMAWWTRRWNFSHTLGCRAASQCSSVLEHAALRERAHDAQLLAFKPEQAAAPWL